MLAGAVDRDLRRTDQACDRGGVDDAALILFEHHRQHMFQPQKNADHVDIEHPTKRLQRISRDRRHVAFDAGVVVEHVDGAELVDGGADILRDLVLIGDVGSHGKRLRGGRQILDRALQVQFPAVDGNNAGAAFGQQADGCGADDAGSPGDDGDLAIQTNSIGHVWRFPVAPVDPDFPAFARARERSSEATISSGPRADQWS